jgi:hypothetical protein
MAFVAAGLLLQTESRGALVGAGAAVILLAGFRLSVGARREVGADANGTQTTPVGPADHPSLTLSTRSGRGGRGVVAGRWAAGLVALSVLVIYSQQLGVNGRMAAITSGEDGSSNVRVALYSSGMKMIAAAPLGWGHGEAGNAFGQWYQEIGDSRSYLSLVNSHLTWMADYGVLFQCVYITGWCFMLLLCWPFDGHRRGEWPPPAAAPTLIKPEAMADRKGSHILVVSFAAWITLGICGFFSSVLTLPWLWIFPGVLLILCLLQRYRSQCWPTKRQWRFASFMVLAGFIGLQVAAHVFARDSRLSVSSNRIEIGERPETVAIFQPDRQIIGDKYGHTLREYVDEVGGFTVLRSVTAEEDLSQFDTIILTGDSSLPDLGNFTGRIVWMNPPAGIDEVALKALGEQSLTVIVGSLGDWRRSRVWQSLVEEHPNWKLTELRGVADFIPAWPRYLAPLMNVNERE